MQIKKTDQFYVVHLQKGDEVIASLRKFAEDNNISAAHINGIGTTSAIELGFFDKEVKEYQTVQFEEDMEMLSVTGSISRFGQDFVVHLHGVFSDDEFTTYGGHVISATILATGEFFIFTSNAVIERKPEPEFKLNLFNLE